MVLDMYLDLLSARKWQLLIHMLVTFPRKVSQANKRMSIGALETLSHNFDHLRLHCLAKTRFPNQSWLRRRLSQPTSLTAHKTDLQTIAGGQSQNVLLSIVRVGEGGVEDPVVAVVASGRACQHELRSLERQSGSGMGGGVSLSRKSVRRVITITLRTLVAV